MGLTQSKINRQLTKLKQAPKIETSENAKLLIFPFNITLGTTNSSEIGLFKDNYDPADFGSFEKIFSGRDSVLIKWENSTFAEKVNATDTFLTKTFQVGAYSQGIRLNTTSSTNFSSSSEDADFVSQRNIKNISVQFFDWKPSEEDIFKFYIIPESGTSNIFYIQTVNSYYHIDNGELIYSEVLFTNLTTELGQSGRSINNFVQFSAAGEGYAFPRVETSDGIKSVSIDEIKLQDRPVDEIQIEIFGPSAITGITIMGRPIGLEKTSDDKWVNKNRIDAPRLLFPYKMTTPESSDISKTSSSETNYYAFQNASVNLIKYWTEWKDKVAANYDLTKTKNYEGVLETDYKETLKTNADPTTKLDYWNSNFTLNLDEVDQNVNKTSPFFDNNFNWTTKNDLSLPQWFMYNSLIYLDTERLPISITESTGWSLKSIPIIGPFLNILTLGIPIGWQNQDIKVNAKKINAIIPCAVYDFGASGTILGGTTSEGALAMDFLRNDTNDSVSALVGTNNVITSLRFKITDQVNQGGTTKNTVDLAQPEGPNKWVFTDNEQPINPQLTTYQGYALDLINFKLISKSEYKITAYSNGAPVYSARFQTKSKFSESVREWSNTIKLSNWNDTNNKTIPYPAAITPKPPVDVIDPVYENYYLNNKLTGTNMNYFYWRGEDKHQNISNSSSTVRTTFTKAFNKTIAELRTRGYKRATLIYDLIIANTINNVDYSETFSNSSLEVDLTKTTDRNVLSIDKTNQIIDVWVWLGDGSGTSQRKFFGEGGLKFDIDFKLDGENLIIDTDATIDLRELEHPVGLIWTGTSAYFSYNYNYRYWKIIFKLKNIKIST